MKIIVHTRPDWPENDLLHVLNECAANGRVIYCARNKLSVVQWHGCTFVVKEFGSGLKNKLLYSVRRSKAQKSFVNALELEKRNVRTPMPIGYVERRGKMRLLCSSCYVCRFEDMMSLAEALSRYGRVCLSAFASFAAALHEKGIRHDDLNGTNVCVRANSDGNFLFILIDLNRMKIYPVGKAVPIDECFGNLCRFSSLDDDFRFFVDEYLKVRNLYRGLVSRAIKIKQQHDLAVDALKIFKSLSKKIFYDT